MAGQYNLDKGGRVDAGQYKALLDAAMKRYGGDRDRAVRDANIAGGFGNSTAQRFMHAAAPAAGGGRGGRKGDEAEAADNPREERAENVPLPRSREEALVQPPSLPNQAALQGVPPDLMGLPGYAQLQGVPPDLQGRVPQNAVGGGVPMSPALSMASVLRSVPPELLGQGSGLPPPFKVPFSLRYPPPELVAPPRAVRPGGNNGGYPAAGVYG